ncbi:hypothetical protein AAG570_004348 [Ranatra chinensis]|uniref:Amino acid transporter transmembrane domain-containing protein n=1 Tax=Ranatra chinensis TaxID=642074 RepID=A0ABD0YP60_9HEMI
MFAMGFAFKNAGLGVGTCLTVFLGLLCLYCNHLLITACLCMRRKLGLEFNPTFSETVEYCFQTGPRLFKMWSPLARVTVKMFIVVTQMGFCSVYYVLVATTLHEVVLHYGYDIDARLYMVGVYVPIVMFCLIRSLKFLTPVSLASNLMLVVSISATIIISCFDLPEVQSRNIAADPWRLPLYFGTTIYAFEGISLILPLLSEMRNQDLFHTWLGVMNIGLVVVTALMTTVGFIGYLKYGEHTKGTLTLNLPPGDIISTIVKVMLAVGIAFTFPIQFYAANDVFWFEIDRKYGPLNHPVLYESFLRVLLVTVTLALAILIPKIGLFISLIGAVSSTFLALVYPALCDIAVRCCPQEDMPLTGRWNWLRLSVDAFILAVAILGFAAGTYCSVVDLVHAFATRGFESEA